MDKVILPPPSSGKEVPDLSGIRSITLIGANGAGKTRFMEEMISLAGNRAYSLSALSATFPERMESTMPGSVDDLYRRVAGQHSYMRTDAVSELDKLMYMVYIDELEYLFSLKEGVFKEGKRIKLRQTKLDRICALWEKLFPGNRIVHTKGSVRFATTAGDDLITVNSLSQGEKTVLYYATAVLFAMDNATIFVDSPSLFIHPALTGTFWDSIESLRPDCKFVYNSVDIDFLSSRRETLCIWVKSYNSEEKRWDYDVLKNTPLAEDLLVELTGSRRPVIFVEGDSQHSIDIKLYSLVFKDWTIRPLGSCDKVIESTRTFNDLRQMHHLRSRGIVDRDRRSEQEVEYLRNKEIMVPEVAEIENIFLLEDVIRVMANRRGRDAEKIIRRVRKDVIHTFKQKADQQTLQHVRHKVKRDVECKIDGKFSCITALETHLKSLIHTLQPRKHYNRLREEFAVMVRNSDYPGILRVFNHKPMLPDSGIAQLLGYRSKDEYIRGVLDVLRNDDKDAETLRNVI
ncbi:MAG: DUF4435 domain-containing protein, partial [Muribaculaceae bacterium]|nr:DUF4435 domain-containing protein [Muribaculaceae bacterium]